MFDVTKEIKKMHFPSKIKNFTNAYYPPLFVKQDITLLSLEVILLYNK